MTLSDLTLVNLEDATRQQRALNMHSFNTSFDAEIDVEDQWKKKHGEPVGGQI
jgi:hypothetical protein